MMRVASSPNHAGYILRMAAKTLYVADPQHNQVLIYDPTTVNPSPIGSITDEMNFPSGLAVDRKGTLYVANQGNSTVTEYRAGKTKAFFKISSGLSAPYGIGVDGAGRVFVSNLTGGVLGYKPGKTVPDETVAAGPNPCGVAIDGKNNVYVASDSENRVYVIPAGTSTAQNLNLQNLNGPIGLAFNDRDALYVGNYGGNYVAIYPSGATSPSKTITIGSSGPTLSGFVKGGVFFQSVPRFRAGSRIQGKANLAVFNDFRHFAAVRRYVLSQTKNVTRFGSSIVLSAAHTKQGPPRTGWPPARPRA